ncbi:formate dehydrogenase accessory sulfurtransferase FdhD [Phosphitispora sp. TUW77]|uniref:formate dehydrogenase accessory sulfurtransferase FdhD n=1 Tax=Phosphitispora sp. TUW77 TaxID=3152361 RepID=UPI003AB22AB9
MNNTYRTVRAWRIKEGKREEVEDPITVESPLTIYFNENEIVTLLCTMEYLDELAVGFLCSEGFLKDLDDLKDAVVDTETATVRVTSRKTAVIAEETFLKRYITTGCGKGTSFYHLSDAVLKPMDSDLRISSGQILALMGEAQKMSELFKTTGGVHSSAVCSKEGILYFREDVGRHNSVDKLIGRCFLEGIDMGDKVLLTTGRISSEILIKAAKMAVPVIASRSAPTDLAVKHAEELGVTIAGFVRNKRMNVYTFPERILI